MFPRRWQQQVEWPACLIAFRIQWRGKMTRKLRSQHREEEEEEEEEDDQYGLSVVKSRFLFPGFPIDGFFQHLLETLPGGNDRHADVYIARELFGLELLFQPKSLKAFPPPFLPTCIFLCLGLFFLNSGKVLMC
jgi:hypothetical protein